MVGGSYSHSFYDDEISGDGGDGDDVAPLSYPTTAASDSTARIPTTLPVPTPEPACAYAAIRSYTIEDSCTHDERRHQNITGARA